MRRQCENLEQNNKRIQFSFSNHVSLAERKIAHLEEALKEALTAKEAALEKSLTFEKQNTERKFLRAPYILNYILKCLQSRKSSRRPGP